MSHSQVLIIGGGTAGIMTASQLLKKDSTLKISLIEPSDTHWYQPAFTLVGANTYDYEKTKRPMSSVIPKGVNWIKDYADGFDPENNLVKTKTSGDLTYDFLVVCPGLIMAPHLIEGLPEALGKGVVCSNYTDPKHTWEVLRNFKGGNAVFTQPTTPIKCGGAPQKMAYMAADYIHRNGLADKSNIIYATPGSVIFGIKEIASTLNKVLHRYNMHFKPFYAPVKIDNEKQEIHFRSVAPDDKQFTVDEGNVIGEHMVGQSDIVMPYDMLHLAPPQMAPDFIRDSTLVNEAKWLEVDQYTMQHKRYQNIFGLGDVAGLPTAKTGAAIRKQVPVVVDNVALLIKHNKMGDKAYNGYSSCPLVTGYGKMVLAEFDYEGKFTPDPKLKQMLIMDSSKELRRLWWLKKYILPYLYWNKMMKGVDM